MTVVRLELEGGEVLLEVFEERAPKAAGYFLRLVDAGAYDGTTIYRSTRLGSANGPRLVQGGPLGSVLAPSPDRPAELGARAELLPDFETTNDSGLLHDTGTLSLARSRSPRHRPRDPRALPLPRPLCRARRRWPDRAGHEGLSRVRACRRWTRPRARDLASPNDRLDASSAASRGDPVDAGPDPPRRAEVTGNLPERETTRNLPGRGTFLGDWRRAKRARAK